MPAVLVLAPTEAPAELLDGVRHLLDEAFAGGLSEDDWEHTLGGWHVVVLDDGAPVAHAAVVPRALEAAGRSLRTGYVEGMATVPERRGQGLGSLVMGHVGPLVRAHFELGALSTGLHRFYGRFGWERWRGPTFARRGGELIRTEDDDDGVMVLRFGPSLGLDLAGPIVCEARAGDHW